MSWSSRAATNLLPLSLENSNLAQALREWRYTGEYNDLEAPVEHCKLCDHPDIRYQFEIRNLHTGKDLLIGSECINRFNIAATDEEGRVLNAAGTREKVERDRRRLIEESRKRRVVKTLVALAHLDKDFNIQSFVDYLQTRGAFTPKQLSILFWRLDKHGVDYNAKDFRLTIRRGREKAQLKELEDWKLQRLLPCMSATQLSFLDCIGRIAVDPT